MVFASVFEFSAGIVQVALPFDLRNLIGSGVSSLRNRAFSRSIVRRAGQVVYSSGTRPFFRIFTARDDAAIRSRRARSIARRCALERLLAFSARELPPREIRPTGWPSWASVLTTRTALTKRYSCSVGNSLTMVVGAERIVAGCKRQSRSRHIECEWQTSRPL